MKQKLTSRFVDLFYSLMLKRSDSVKIKHVKFKSFVFSQVVPGVTCEPGHALHAGDPAVH